MTFTITLNARALKAAALCVGANETRFYLMGVFVETSVAGVTLTATDGHRLVAMNHAPIEDSPHDDAAPSVIVPTHLIDKIKIGKRSPDYATLQIDSNCNPPKLTLSFDNLIVVGDAVDGSYPAARRLAILAFNSPDAGKPAQFNPAYVAAFGKMAELMTGSKPNSITILPNGGSPALVDFIVDRDAGGVEAFGILMPCRMSESKYAGKNIPAWFGPTQVTTELAAAHDAAQVVA